MAAWRPSSRRGGTTCRTGPDVLALETVPDIDEADVLTAIAVAREVTGKPVIVYPDSGEEWDARRRAWARRSRYSRAQPRQWIAAGARIVGGCCRVRPADIAEIAQAVAAPAKSQ
jgi:S-methylmethionine-dependent homocysteine/selenocysteine methylase